MALALLAGQMGIPFIPNRTHLGSDIEKYNENIRRLECPFTGETLGAVKAVNPDVGILHVQIADSQGNAQKWGSLGIDVMGINACDRVIVTTERIVEPEVIRRDPNRTMVPGIRVNAVVEEPWGSYPMHLAGCYRGDVRAFFDEIEGKGEEGLERYMKEFVYGVKNRKEFLEKVNQVKGQDYLKRLMVDPLVSSEPIHTGV